MKDYIIATDGAYSPARNQGGIGIVIADINYNVLQQGSHCFKSKNGKPYTDITNQTMEIIAALTALKSIKKPIHSLLVLSDSMYVIGNASLGWKPKKNVKLIERFKSEIVRAQSLVETPIKFQWVKGHQNNPSRLDFLNTICDKLANDASKSI